MKPLIVLIASVACQITPLCCWSQEAIAVADDDAQFSSLTSADKRYTQNLMDLDRGYAKELRALNAKYQANRKLVRKQQIKLLELGKSAAMKDQKLDSALAIRDRITMLHSETLLPPVTFIAHEALISATNRAVLNGVGFSKVWKWAKADSTLVFKGGKDWFESDKFHWTETRRSPACIHFHDKDRNMIGMLYANAFFYRKASSRTWKMVTGSWVPDAG